MSAAGFKDVVRRLEELAGDALNIGQLDDGEYLRINWALQQLQIEEEKLNEPS